MKPILQMTVGLSETVRGALSRLDETGAKILIVIDEDGRLIRTITDGDIRRSLLSGGNLDDEIQHLPPKIPVFAPQDIMPDAALAKMDEAEIEHLLLLDEAQRPIGIVRRADLLRPVLLSTPHMSDFERGYVEEAFETNWIAPLGPNVDRFEAELCATVGAGHAAAVTSGTAAIHLALRILGVDAGDSVFCSNLTFIASCAPIIYQGATPVFIDSDAETWNMCPLALERALEDARRENALPKAVIVVNLYGQSADYDPILEICDRYGVPVVEDAAESLGATYKGRASGTIGKVGIYSFNGNKIITTSGGGMLVSDDGDLIRRARYLATQARQSVPHYEHTEVGYNYRMSNILAGVGRGQLRVLAERIAARRALFQSYVDGLADVEGIHWMPEASFGTSNRWLTTCTIDPEYFGMTPGELCRRLALHGVEARHVWKPMHRQPVFRGASYVTRGNTSFSDALFDNGLCLPSGSNTSIEQREHVVNVLREIARNA